MILQKQFNGVEVDFEPLIKNKNVMVNATQMAKVFGKYTKDFLILESTQNFILECLKKENSPFLGVEKEEDLVSSKQKSGTWMHRVLAIKFAAWLNPAFELWVYKTIDEILLGAALEIRESISETVKIQREQDLLANQIFKANPELFERYIKTFDKLRDAKTRRRSGTKTLFDEAKTLFD
jgi:phage regulator Rha-like protein